MIEQTDDLVAKLAVKLDVSEDFVRKNWEAIVASVEAKKLAGHSEPTGRGRPKGRR